MYSTEYHAGITKKWTLYVLLRINLQAILLIVFQKKVQKSVYGILSFVRKEAGIYI